MNIYRKTARIFTRCAVLILVAASILLTACGEVPHSAEGWITFTPDNQVVYLYAPLPNYDKPLRNVFENNDVIELIKCINSIKEDETFSYKQELQNTLQLEKYVKIEIIENDNFKYIALIWTYADTDICSFNLYSKSSNADGSSTSGLIHQFRFKSRKVKKLVNKIMRELPTFTEFVNEYKESTRAAESD